MQDLLLVLSATNTTKTSPAQDCLLAHTNHCMSVAVTKWNIGHADLLLVRGVVLPVSCVIASCAVQPCIAQATAVLSATDSHISDKSRAAC